MAQFYSAGQAQTHNEMNEPTQRETTKQIERVYGAFDDEINNERISSAKRIYIVDDETEIEMSENQVLDARSFGHKVVLK